MEDYSFSKGSGGAQTSGNKNGSSYGVGYSGGNSGGGGEYTLSTSYGTGGRY